MKQLILILSAVLFLSCSNNFEDSYDKLYYLDISTTQVQSMTDEDYEIIFSAMKRLGVHDCDGYLVMQNVDYQSLRVSRRLFSFIKKSCYRGNCLVDNSSELFPKTKSMIKESGSGSDSDCVGYALYGMGADKTSALDYIHSNFPNGVLSDSLDFVVGHFFPNYVKVSVPENGGSWNNRPQPLIWFEVQEGFAHAVNCKVCDASTHDVMYFDYQSNSAGFLSGSSVKDYYFAE